MSISRTMLLILINAISYMIFLGIFLFGILGTDNVYYYRTIAFGLSMVFLFVTLYLVNRRIKEKDWIKQTPSS